MGLGTSGVGCYLFSASPKSLGDLDTTWGWKAPGSEVDLRDMIQELQGVRVGIAKGTTASALTRVRSAGGASAASSLISQSDVIFGAVEFDNVAACGLNWISLRNDVRISATAGYISISGASTANGQMLIFWLDKTGYAAY